MDLILHIGLGKTGTTTIQEEALADYPNYLGRSINKENIFGNNACEELYRLLKKFRKGEQVKESCSNWVGNIKSFKDEKKITANNIIISYEYLSSNYLNKITNFPYLDRLYKPEGVLPVASFINYLSTHWDIGKVRVLLTLRNQPDWMASKYAQHSNRILNASQKDFEQRISKLIDSGDTTFMNFYRWYSDLQKVVGKEHMCVLLMENMDKEIYWRELADFMELENFPYEKFLTNRVIKNKRRSDTNVWKLQPFNNALKRKIKKSWSVDRAIGYRKTALNVAGKFDKLFLPYFISIAEHQREDEIYLTDELKERIQSYTAASNEQLSDIVGQDLKKFGY